MFDIYYAGRKDMPECDEAGMVRSDHGHKMCDIRMSMRFLTERGHKLPTDPSKLEAYGYTFVGTTTLKDKEEVFEAYQGMFCGQDFADHIREVGANHTSMSVGDILVEKSNGNMYFCDGVGWKELS